MKRLEYCAGGGGRGLKLGLGFVGNPVVDTTK